MIVDEIVHEPLPLNVENDKQGSFGYILNKDEKYRQETVFQIVLNTV